MTGDAMLAVGQEHSITIDNLAFGGDGVGRALGMTVFVPDVCPGEIVRIKITQLKKRHARGELLAVESPSDHRVAPLCPLSGTCGGCQLQHLDYPRQLAAKTQAVRDALQRVGSLPDVPVADIIPSPIPYGYRNKAELHAFADDDERLALGFHTRSPEQLVEVPNCPLCLPEVNELIDLVGDWIRTTGWPAYDPPSGQGLVRTIGLRYAVSTREATVLLVTGRRDVPEKRPWIDALRNEDPRIVGVRHVARTRASQSRLGRHVGDMLGRPLRLEFGGLSLRVTPEAFFQVNDLLLESLWEHLHAALDPRPEDRVADVYGGVGTYGLRLAGEVAEVAFVELDGTAVNDARANAKHNRVENVEIVRGQAEQRLAGVFGDRRPDLLILDPPRKGCSEAVLRTVAAQGPRRIVYVSCDPTTLARDLSRLAGLGYATAGVQPFDLFPQTYHIECLATLVRG